MSAQPNLPDETAVLKRRIASLQQENAALLEQVAHGQQALVLQKAERQKTEAILQQQRDISLLLSASSDLPGVLHGLLAAVCQIDGLDCGGVYLVEEGTGDLTLMVHAGLPQEFVVQSSCYKADSPQAALVMQGTPIYSHYTAVAPVINDVSQRAGLRALAIIPVKFEGEVVAVFNLASHTVDEIDLKTRQALETIVAPMGGVVARVRTEAALSASRRDLANLFNTLDDFLFIVDGNGRILEMNPAASKRLGYTIEELHGRHISDVHPPERQAEVLSVLAAMLAGETAVCPIPLQSKQGQAIPVETRIVHGRWQGQDVIFGISRDMTAQETARQALQNARDRLEVRVRERTANLEKANLRLKQEVSIRQQAELALKESQARLSAFFNQSLDGCFFMMLDKPIRWDDTADKEALLDYAFEHQHITEINDAFLVQYGAERSAFMGMTPRDFFAHDLAYGRNIWRTFWDNGRIRLETNERKADGTPMWIEGEYVCLYDDDGRITGHFGIQRDITDRKQAVTQLKESRKMLRLVLDNIPQAVFWKDRQSVYLGCNRVFADNADYADPEALIGLTDFDMPWAKDQAQFYRAVDQQVMETNQPQYNIEEPQTLADNRQIWLRTNKIPLHDNAGNVVGILGTYEDITELKRAEEALRHSEAMYRRMVDTAEEGIWLLDADARTQFVNNKMAEMLQYKPDDMIGRHLFDFMDESARALSVENLQRRRQGVREQHDFKFQRRDGSDIWTIVATSPIFDDDGRYLGALGMLTDITQRRQVQKELERHAERLEMLRHIEHAILEAQSPEAIAHELLSRLLETLPFVRGSIVLVDWETETGEILASMSLLDTQLTAGLRRPLDDFGFREEILSGEPFYQPDLNETETLPPVIQQLKREGVTCIIGMPLVSQSLAVGMFLLGADKPHLFAVEHVEMIRELAHSLALAIQQARLMEQIQQQTRELEQRVADRTHDLQEANERLQELDRLKSKFISDITHELRTPVTNMLLYLDLMRFGKTENHAHYQQILYEQAERLRQLVVDSLELSRLDLGQEDVHLVPLDLNAVLAETVSPFMNQAEEKGLAFRFVPETQLPELLADGDQMGRMVGSLLKNAIDFTLTGQVQIFTLLDETAEFVGIRIQDTGIGFTEDDHKHCFIPFYRGERVGQFNIPGNGLGLALAKRIVDLHNGRIEIESEVDQGSTITVWIPLAP